MVFQSEIKGERLGRSPFASGLSGERLFGGLRRSRDHGNEGAPADSLAKLHGAALQREQRVVATHADPVAGMKLGAALPYDDVAGNHDLAAVLLDAEPPS